VTNMKKVFEFVWRLLRSNLLLKIVSLFFAVVLWSYVLTQTNPTREQSFADIPLRYANQEVLSSQNLAISGSLSDILDLVDVRVEVNQNDIKRLSRASVDAYVDLSVINGPGSYKLMVQAKPNVGQAVEISPSVVELTVYPYKTRQVPVNVNMTGDVANGFYAMTPEISPGVVTISGASVDVDRVASAVCDIDLTGLAEGYNKSVPIRLLDSEGSELDGTLFSGGQSSVIVKLQVLATKVVPVDVNSAIMGQNELAAGYEIVGITSTPESVMIAGEPGAIRGISSISLMPYTVSGASSSVAVILDYQLPEGVSMLTEGKAHIYVEIRPIMDTRHYENIAIEARNLAAGLTAQLDVSRTDVTVMAGIPQLSRLKRSDIVPYVDLEGKGRGKYTVPVQFELSDGFAAENFSSGVATVVVTIN
jgi:YbbR domain-containing protein